KPVAGAFLLINGQRAEIPWACCRQDAKPMGFNMKLYWEVLSAVMARGCVSFDFGRSTAGSGTYKFKRQWGAEPVQLYWHRWERKGNPSKEPKPATQGRLMQHAARVWRHLPLPAANLLGPLISPSLPW